MTGRDREVEIYRLAYNAHEQAESAAMDALRSALEEVDTDTLACVCDPQWGWESRSWMSVAIIDCANEVLNARLDALVAS